MNPQAAQELLDLILLDDYVARKQALDNWSRKWIATLYVDALHHGKLAQTKLVLMENIYTALRIDELYAINFGMPVGDDGELDKTRLACEMHVVLQKPREVDAGKNAAQKMMDMAKGDGK